MDMKKKSCVGILLLVILIFSAHRSVPFMMDDEWYATNLATGEQLQSLGDVIEGQVWHYLNWGGRSITHGLLQLTLMMGELGADILNLGMTLLLAYMMCVLAQQRSSSYFLMSLSMLIALNANVKMSMFWQAGLVNYVYSAVWILLFLFPYLKTADAAAEGEAFQTDKPLRGITLWILPLGVITGWSNENMGPACFVLAAAVIFYYKVQRKGRAPLWMYLGAAASFLGSVMVVAAPGNFVRSGTIEEKGVLATLTERGFSMLRAGIDFLFPMGILLVLLLILYRKYFQEKLRPSQLLLLAGSILSYGAMVLSPHYPDRAAFGTMVLGIVLMLTLLAGILKKCPAMQKAVNGLLLCSCLYSAAVLTDMMCNTGALI